MTKRTTRRSNATGGKGNNKKARNSPAAPESLSPSVKKEQEESFSSSDAVDAAAVATAMVDVVVDENHGERRALIKALRDAGDLPSSYAALKLIRESSFVDALSEEEAQLVADASLAVPYVMSNMAVEHCTRPRSLGGLAYSRAKAEKLIRPLFAKLGPACCADTITETEIEKACEDLSNQDARKIVPKLKLVGTEARRKVEELRKAITETESQEAAKEVVKTAVEC